MDSKAREALVEAALQARANAYAPYSVYNVGAAAMAADGTIHSGCNVENASYGLTVCAERNAVAAMVGSGQVRLVALAVATLDGGTPCGACRQVMQEFASEGGVAVLLVDERGSVTETTLGALLPRPFTGQALKKC
jgi:cytidine deaminase